MSPLFSLFKLLKYSTLRSNEHGIHSPFVFDLYNQVFKNNENFYAYEKVEELRKRLLADQRQIEVLDLGAGSVSGNKKTRAVKDISGKSVKSKKYGQLLFRLVNYFQSETIIELGTSVGISTIYLAIARSKSEIITIEGSPEIRKIALANFEQSGLKNIISEEGNFDDRLPMILKKIKTADLVFFDGNHRKEATLAYFRLCLEKANDKSIFIFDDIYWSKGMAEAWEIIKADPSVTVTIDIFQMGIVFFRKEQAKEHFILAY
jgi:predicted O-methyltransferase YrrM